MPISPSCSTCLPDIVVFHRLGWTEEVGRFAGRLAELGAALVYDSDDLVFTPDAASLVTWPPDVTEAQRRQLFEAQRRMLMTCWPRVVQHRAARARSCASRPDCVDSERRRSRHASRGGRSDSQLLRWMTGA